MKRLAVVNQKGGVGKTTTAVSLAAYLARIPRRVLLVDLDPQANATSGLGVEESEGLNSALRNERPAGDLAVRPDKESFDLLPAHPDLVGLTADLLDQPTRLRNLLQSMEAEYDLMLMDVPPSLGPLTVNALVAAEGLVVPIQAEYYALEGIARLMETLASVREQLNPGLRLLGIVLTMYDGRTLLAQQVEANVRAHFGGLVFWTVIPRNVRLSESPSHGRSIAAFAPTSSGAQAYRRLAKEVLKRVEEDK